MAKINDSKPNGYALSRAWFDFALSNPDKVSGNHTALYLWIVEINNRIGWLEKFGLTVREAMDGMSCKSRTTYFKCFQNLIDWGFVEIIVAAKNQYQCNIIAIPNNVQAQDDQLYRHRTIIDTDINKSTDTDTGTIPKTNKPLNQETIKTISGNKKFIPPTHYEVYDFFESKINETFWSESECTFQSKKFIDFYESKSWMIGKNKMTKWKAAASGWVNRSNESAKNNTNGATANKGVVAALTMYEQLKSKP